MRRLRELDRTQGWLARKMGVTPSAVSRWAKGTLPILPHRRRELALVLGISAEEFVPKEQEVAAAA